MRPSRVRFLLAGSTVLALAGCGGGGGGVGSTPPPTSAPAPTPAPSPAPTPAPAPSSAVNYNTAEYQRSAGLVQASAISAYQRGVTGAGITVGVIDSGVDVDSPEFAGRISGASADLVADRGLQDESGHGTAVSSVILAARNNSGTHGVAFDSTLLVLRTDSVGSCATTGEDSGCKHSDQAMARALDRAVASGAKVVNISLGGSAGGTAFRNAIGRAAAAGLVIVISSGNDGAAEPDALSLIAKDGIARGQVIIAGSVDSNTSMSSFSNRAGTGASNYLVALGERVRAPDQDGTAYLYSGTSFAAPHIAGALALLAQAFPNLTGRQLVELLYTAATDLGDAGTDAVYGRGLLNIARAFQPIGAMSLANSAVAVSGSDNGALSTPMGDAGARNGPMGAVILDGFDRAFAVELAGTVAGARPNAALGAALAPGYRNLAATGSASAVALQIRQSPTAVALDRMMLTTTEADRAVATAGMVTSRLSRATGIALGISFGGATLAGQLQGARQPAFLVARDGARELGFDRRPGAAAAIRHQLGDTAFWASAEQGDALTPAEAGLETLVGSYRANGYAMIGAGMERRLGALTTRLSLSQLNERRTVLGARFGPLFGVAGADSWFVDAEASAPLGEWTLAAGIRQGWTRIGAGGARPNASMIRSNAWRLDLSRDGFLTGSDRLGFRVAQPLRVSGGGFTLDLPSGYNYATGVTTFAPVSYGLSPGGREIDVEAAYSMPLWTGRVDANLFWRRDPGNIAAMPDDRGAAVRFSRGF